MKDAKWWDDASHSVKVRMLSSFGGMVEGLWDLKRGDVIELPRPAARRLISNGHASARHVKTDRDQLPPGYGDYREESKQFEQWARDEAARSIPEDVRHHGKPDVMVGSPYDEQRRAAEQRLARNGGWLP